MGADNLDGKVGRMYVPRQEIGSIALRKMKVSSTCPPDLLWQFEDPSYYMEKAHYQSCILSGLL